VFTRGKIKLCGFAPPLYFSAEAVVQAGENCRQVLSLAFLFICFDFWAKGKTLYFKKLRIIM